MTDLVFAKASNYRIVAALSFLSVYFTLRFAPPAFLFGFLFVSSVCLVRWMSIKRTTIIGACMIAFAAVINVAGAFFETVRGFAAGMSALLIVGSFFRFQDLQLLIRTLRAPVLVQELLEQIAHSGLMIAHSTRTTLNSASLRKHRLPWRAKISLLADAMARSAEKAFFRIERSEEAREIRNPSYLDGKIDAPPPALVLHGIQQNINGVRILSNIDLTLQQGEWIAILGSSGAGKTSLLRLIAGFSKCSSGSLSRFGSASNIGQTDPRIQLLFQDPLDQIIGPTPREDLRWSFPWASRFEAESDKEIEAALDRLGLETVADRSILNLSAGERKRVTLASMLPLKPRVVLLDEPTSGLDQRNSKNVISVVEDNFRSATLVWVTHELHRIPEAIKRIIVMDEGRIIYDGERCLLPQTLIEGM